MNATNDTPAITQLCACRLGLAAGIVWGLGMFLLGIITMFSNSYGHVMVQTMRSVYPGYAPDSFGGAVLGLIWGLIDGFICVTVAVLLYNAMARFGKCCCGAGKPTADTCGTAAGE